MDMKKERREETSSAAIHPRACGGEGEHLQIPGGAHQQGPHLRTVNTTQLVKKAQQRLYFLRRLRKFDMSAGRLWHIC